ncbi:unnamed protein product, partial [Mesorhabditis spiculigera]
MGMSDDVPVYAATAAFPLIWFILSMPVFQMGLRVMMIYQENVIHGFLTAVEWQLAEWDGYYDDTSCNTSLETPNEYWKEVKPPASESSGFHSGQDDAYAGQFGRVRLRKGTMERSGGFGQVYILEKYYPPIVVKELPGRNENDDVYKREWTVLKELAHVHVVLFVDIPPDYSDYTAGCARIFMEYCQYGTLEEAIPNPEWIYSVSTIVEWAKALFSGLVYLHGKVSFTRISSPPTYCWRTTFC